MRIGESLLDPDGPFADFVVQAPSLIAQDLGVEVLRPGPAWVLLDIKQMGMALGTMQPSIILHQPATQEESDQGSIGLFLSVASIDVPSVSLRALSRIMADSPEAGLEILAAEMGDMGNGAELAQVGPYNAVLVSSPGLLGGTNYLWIVVRPSAVIYLVAEGFTDPVQPAQLMAETITFLPLDGEEASGAGPLPNPDEAGLSPDEQRQRLVAISQNVRGLESLDQVEFNFMDEAGLREVLEGDAAPDADRARQSYGEERMLKLLGLIPQETDLTALVLDLYQSEIAGYYDDETKEFVLIQPEAGDAEAKNEEAGSAEAGNEPGIGETGLDLMAQITFVHEFVHALQDQHFDLARFGGKEKNGTQENDSQENSLKQSDDEQLAARALVEGDAQFATSLYIIDYVDLVALYNLTAKDASADNAADPEATDPATSTPETDTLELQQEAIMEGELDTALLDAAPAFVRESMIFPYISGEMFVLAIYDDLGWEGVAEVWANPPRSTEQILHPELYPEDLPTTVDLPEDLAAQLSAATGTAWEEYVRNVWGEFQLRLMLMEHLNKGIASTGADGWDGDQFVYLSDGEQEVVVMATVWDSASEARSARTALRTWLDRSGFGSSGNLRFIDEEADLAAGAPVRHIFLTSRDGWTYFALATDSPSLEGVVSALGWE